MTDYNPKREAYKFVRPAIDGIDLCAQFSIVRFGDHSSIEEELNSSVNARPQDVYLFPSEITKAIENMEEGLFIDPEDDTLIVSDGDVKAYSLEELKKGEETLESCVDAAIRDGLSGPAAFGS